MVCCHNHAHYLEYMVNDIFDQTLHRHRWKLLIIFDECTDDSEEVFKKIWQRQCGERHLDENWLEVRILRRSKKEGLAACKNFGLRYCDTEFLTFLDADDGMLPDRLQIQLDFVQKNKDVDICSTGMWVKKGTDDRMFVSFFGNNDYQHHEDIMMRLPHENVICGASVMMAVETLKEMGGYSEDPRHKGIEDWALWVKCLSRGKRFYKIPERLYVWRNRTSAER